MGEIWGTQTIEELVNLGDSTPGPDFAALAPAISELAEEGDAVAAGVLQQAAADLVESVLLVRAKLRRKHDLTAEVPVAWIGSVIGKVRLVREPFFAGLQAAAPEMPVRETEVAGIEGAVWRAQQLALKWQSQLTVGSAPLELVRRSTKEASILPCGIDGDEICGLPQGRGAGLRCSRPVMAAGFAVSRRSPVDGGACELDEICESAIQREHAAGEHAAGGGAAIGHLHGKSAELIFAIGHSGGAHGVGDQDGALRAFGSPPQPDHLRRGVDAVADELGDRGESLVSTMPRMPGSR